MAAVATGSGDREEVLTAALASDLERAFERLVIAYRDPIVSFAARMLRDDARAEDVAQEVFVRAYHALRTYDPGRRASLRLRSWLYAIAHNLVRNAVRDAPPRSDSLEYPDGQPRAAAAQTRPSPEEEILRSESWDRIAEGIARLSPALRPAFVMRYVEELPYEEIAQTLERPIGTVKASAHRGLMTLRAYLEKDDE